MINNIFSWQVLKIYIDNFMSAKNKKIIKYFQLFSFLLLIFVKDNYGSNIIAATDSENALAHNNGRKIAISSEGTINLVFQNNNDIYYVFLKATESGWSEPINVSNSVGISGYPSIAVDSTNRKHIVWQDNTIPGNPEQADRFRIYYKNFIEPDEISTRMATIIGESVGDCQNPSITIAEDGQLYAAWAAFMGLTVGWEINYSVGKLIGSGLTGTYDWTYPEIPGKDMGMGSSFFPMIATKYNVTFIAWLEYSPTEAVVNLMKYLTTENWSEPFDLSSAAIGPSPFSTAGIPNLVVGPDTIVHLVFQEEHGFKDIFYLDYKAGDSLIYCKGVNISHSEFPSSTPSISIDKDNNLYAVWQENDNDNSEIFLCVRHEGSWLPPENISLSSQPSFQPQLPAVAGDSLLIIWLEGSSAPYHIMFKKVKSLITQVERTRTGSEIVPEDHILFQNYPNPFNSVTTIKYYLSSVTRADLTISDILGRHIKTLAHGLENKGFHTLMWNGKDKHGKPVNSGVYMIVFKTEFNQKVKKLLIIN